MPVFVYVCIYLCMCVYIYIANITTNVFQKMMIDELLMSYEYWWGAYHDTYRIMAKYHDTYWYTGNPYHYNSYLAQSD